MSCPVRRGPGECRQDETPAAADPKLLRDLPHPGPGHPLPVDCVSNCETGARIERHVLIPARTTRLTLPRPSTPGHMFKSPQTAPSGPSDYTSKKIESRQTSINQYNEMIDSIQWKFLLCFRMLAVCIRWRCREVAPRLQRGGIGRFDRVGATLIGSCPLRAGARGGPLEVFGWSAGTCRKLHDINDLE